MKSILRKVVSIIFNKYIYLFFIYIYIILVKEPLRKAWSLYFRFRIVNIDDTAKILGHITITDPSKLYIDRYVRIGKDCFFFTDGTISIGDGTIISRNVTIYTGNHDISGEAIPYDNNYIYKSVKIGKGVWIGMNVNITPGVTIGDGAIIGMGTTISKNVKPFDIVVGSQQRIVSSRDRVDFEKNLKEEKFFAKKWEGL